MDASNGLKNKCETANKDNDEILIKTGEYQSNYNINVDNIVNKTSK